MFWWIITVRHFIKTREWQNVILCQYHSSLLRLVPYGASIQCDLKCACLLCG
uniref:Uncharacterized protein n=1 Tax=Anguilla anguilla TaxID=7936 RepID=A0A0E9QT47_ANGAN